MNIDRIKCNIMKTLLSIKHFSIKITDRTQIFISAMWVWACVMFYTMRFINFMLYLIITYTPDSFIIFRSRSKPDKNLPVILDAKIIKNKNKISEENDIIDISNKLNTIINRVLNDDKDSIKLNELIKYFPSISSSLVWISYLTSDNLTSDNLTSDNLTSDNIKKKSVVDDIFKKQINKCVYNTLSYILINVQDKVLYRGSEKENILFGKCPLKPEVD